MTTSPTPGADPIKVGVIADQTGPLSFVGLANANVARMVIGDINAKGGLLGPAPRAVPRGQRDRRRRRGGEGDEARRAGQRRRRLRRHLQLDAAGDQGRRPWWRARRSTSTPSSTRGRSRDPLIFCTGPVPAQQVDPFIPWLMRETGAKTFYLPSADYIWPHVLNARVREVVTANGGAIVGEEYFPLDHTDYRGDGRADRLERRRRGLQHDRAPRGRAVLRAAVRVRLHEPRRAARLHLLRRELPRTWCRRLTSRGCTAASTTTRPSAIRSARELLAQYDALYPGDAKFTGGGALFRPVPRACGSGRPP